MGVEYENARNRKFRMLVGLVLAQATGALFVVYLSWRHSNSQLLGGLFHTADLDENQSFSGSKFDPQPNYQYPAPDIPYDVIVNKTVKQEYFAMCTSVKNQNADIREWLFYHYWLGVNKFYIYDHNSTRPVVLDIQDWVRAGIVEYTVFSGHHKLKPKIYFNNTGQGYAYKDCLKRGRGKHEWLGFIDVDEFLVLQDQPDNRDIEGFLRGYEDYGGLFVNWRIFGSSGHKARPTVSTMEAYTSCLPDPHSIQVKALVHVPYTKGIGSNPHHFNYISGKWAVNEIREVCKGRNGFCDNVSLKSIVIHHYVTKSLEDYQVKMARGGGSGSIKRMTYFNHIDSLSTMVCPKGPEIWQHCCVNQKHRAVDV